MKKFVNILTIMRLGATFLIPWIWNKLSPLAIIIIVAAILLTDTFDGILARKYRVQSLFGALMDTIADKVFGIVIILIVSKYYPLCYWLFMGEIIISIINIMALSFGCVVNSHRIGKQKMWPLGISMIYALLLIFKPFKIALINEPILNMLVIITLIFELLAIIDYIYMAIKDLKGMKIEFNYVLRGHEELMPILFDTDYYLANQNRPLRQLLFKSMKDI